MTEAEEHAFNVRQSAGWSGWTVDADDLRAAADFIMRQQAEIDALKHDFARHLAVVSAELSNSSYDAHYLHSGGG